MGVCIFLLYQFSVFQGLCCFLVLSGLPPHPLEPNIACISAHQVFASGSKSKAFSRLCVVTGVCYALP